MAIVVASLIGGWYTAWHLTKADEKIKMLLLDKVRPFLAQESDIERVELDIHSLHLRGVRLVPKDESFSVEIEDVRLGYRFTNILRYGFTPHKLAHEIVLVHPRLVIQKDFTSIQGESEGDTGLDPREVVEKIETVKRLTLVDAEVFVEDTSKKRIRLAHSMNGWLEAAPLDSAFIRLTGKILETNKNNLTVEGKLNLITGRPVRMGIRFDESESVTELPLLVPDYVQVNSGKIRGDLFFDERRESTGELEIKDGAFSFKHANITFRGVNIKGVLKGKDVTLEGGVQNFNGSALLVSGKVVDVRDPSLDLSIRSSRFNIPTFFSNLLPDAKLSLDGEARFDFHYTGSLYNPIMQGNFVSDNLHAYGIDFDRFDTSIGLQDSVIMIEGEGVQNSGLSLTMKGQMDVSDTLQTTSFALDMQGDLLHSFPSWGFRRIESSRGEMHFLISGELLRLQGTAQGMFSFDCGEGGSFQLRPHFIYRDRDLRITIESNRGFTLNGNVQSPFHGNVHWESEIEGLEKILQPLVNESFRKALTSIDVRGVATGSPDGWDAWIEGLRHDRSRSSKVFDLEFSSESGTGREKREIKAKGTYYEPGGDRLTLVASGDVSEGGFELRHCSIGDAITVVGYYPFESDQNYSGNIQLSDFSFEKFHGLFPSSEPFTGTLQGEIKISGTRSLPRLDLNVNLRDGVFHSVGVFDGELHYIWDRGTIGSGQLDFKLNGTSVLSGKAEWIEEDSLAGLFVGRDFDVGTIVSAFTGRQIIDGQGSLTLSVSGDTTAQALHGSIDVHEGRLGTVSFQNLHAEVLDTLSKKWNFGGGWFSIQNGEVERSDGLRVQFWGDFPKGPGKDADVSVVARGNLPGFLPEISDMFKEAKGSGEIVLRWAGGPGDWVLGSGSIQLDEGNIKLMSFVDEVQKIQGKAELMPEERFIHISRLSGEIDGEQFILTNKPIEGRTNGIVPLIISGLGVNCGILELKTFGKGIRAHLPGFMEKREVGWLGFEGKESEKPFEIAGPVESPLFQGSLYLTDLRLTYPFLTIEGDSGTSKVLEFFERVNWDLRVVPKEDVHYTRTIKSPLGNVYVDLLLMNGFGEVLLDGVTQEEDFQVWGNLVSTEGSIEVLNHFFRPERITFDYPKGTKNPILSGRAFTTVIDSMGMPSTVWLSITQTDEMAGIEREGGPWDKVHFRFSTDNPNLGRTEADLLAALGYSADNIKDRAYDALGTQVDNLVFRPLLRPLERGMRRYLGLDVVRVSSMFSRNIAELRTSDRVSFDPKLLLRSTKLTLGKYLAPGLFLFYSGQVQEGIGFRYHTHGLGFRHALSLEYTIRPDLFLQMEYTYDSQLLSDRREDKRIWLRHVFPF